MRLDEWVRERGRGAISLLQRETGLAYTTVHGAVHGRRCGWKAATAIHDATEGDVPLESLLVGFEAGEAAE